MRWLGKTTLGRRLAEQIGAPLTHLDAVCYDDQWNTLPADELAALQEELFAVVIR